MDSDHNNKSWWKWWQHGQAKGKWKKQQLVLMCSRSVSMVTSMDTVVHPAGFASTWSITSWWSIKASQTHSNCFCFGWLSCVMKLDKNSNCCLIKIADKTWSINSKEICSQMMTSQWLFATWLSIQLWSFCTLTHGFTCAICSLPHLVAWLLHWKAKVLEIFEWFELTLCVSWHPSTTHR